MFAVIMELPDLFIGKIRIGKKGVFYYTVYGAFMALGVAVCIGIGLLYGLCLDKMGIFVEEWMSNLSFCLSFVIWKLISDSIEKKKERAFLKFQHDSL